MSGTSNYILHLYPTRRFTVYHPLSLYQAANRVLRTGDDKKKVALTREYVSAWNNERIQEVYNSLDTNILPPNEPARPYSHFVGYNFAPDSDIPAEKRTKIKNLMRKNTVEYTIHGIANAELYAIDLFWDIIVRYIHYTKDFPKEFFDNMIYIVEQEANHFEAWKQRLEEYGYQFGHFPFQAGLWQSASDTSGKVSIYLPLPSLTALV